MKVRVTHRGNIPGGQTYDTELAEWLVPVSTGSTQGTVEQLQAELTACKEAVGGILASLVDAKLLTIGRAEELAGIHQWFKEYRYSAVEYIMDK